MSIESLLGGGGGGALLEEPAPRGGCLADIRKVFRKLVANTKEEPDKLIDLSNYVSIYTVQPQKSLH